MSEIEKEIPKVNESEVVAVRKGELGAIGDIKNRLDQISGLFFTVVIAVVIAAVAALISAVGVFLDQMRYNNAAYQEYSKNTQALETSLESNEALLQEIKDNQALIMKLSDQLNNPNKK